MATELKAAVVLKKIQGAASTSQSECLTVQDFNYNCKRKRDHTGATSGLSEQVVLEFAIRVNDPNHSKPFYGCLNEDSPFTLSFLFNASFQDQELTDYEDAMMVNGYVVDLVEDFAGSTSGTVNEQVLLHVQMLVCDITYIGSSSNKIISFIK